MPECGSTTLLMRHSIRADYEQCIICDADTNRPDNDIKYTDIFENVFFSNSKPSVVDSWPTLPQHWVNVSSLLGAILCSG